MGTAKGAITIHSALTERWSAYPVERIKPLERYGRYAWPFNIHRDDPVRQGGQLEAFLERFWAEHPDLDTANIAVTGSTQQEVLRWWLRNAYPTRNRRKKETQ